MKHTKEPWEVQHNPEEDIYRGYMIIGNGMEITRLSGMGEEEDRANAYLMAASPKLLGACMAAVKYDEAIKECAGDPNKMSSFCTAQGENLDELYLDWLVKAASAIALAIESGRIEHSGVTMASTTTR